MATHAASAFSGLRSLPRITTCNSSPTLRNSSWCGVDTTSAQGSLDVGGQRFRLVDRRIARDDAPVATDEELAEIPFDRLCAEDSTLLRLQPAPERMRVVAVDVDLGEQGEIDFVVERA